MEAAVAVKHFVDGLPPAALQVLQLLNDHNNELKTWLQRRNQQIKQLKQEHAAALQQKTQEITELRALLSSLQNQDAAVLAQLFQQHQKQQGSQEPSQCPATTVGAAGLMQGSPAAPPASPVSPAPAQLAGRAHNAADAVQDAIAGLASQQADAPAPVFAVNGKQPFSISKRPRSPDVIDLVELVQQQPALKQPAHGTQTSQEAAVGSVSVPQQPVRTSSGRMTALTPGTFRLEGSSSLAAPTSSNSNPLRSSAGAKGQGSYAAGNFDPPGVMPAHKIAEPAAAAAAAAEEDMQDAAGLLEFLAASGPMNPDQAPLDPTQPPAFEAGAAAGADGATPMAVDMDSDVAQHRTGLQALTEAPKVVETQEALATITAYLQQHKSKAGPGAGAPSKGPTNGPHTTWPSDGGSAKWLSSSGGGAGVQASDGGSSCATGCPQPPPAGMTPAAGYPNMPWVNGMTPPPRSDSEAPNAPFYDAGRASVPVGQMPQVPYAGPMLGAGLDIPTSTAFKQALSMAASTLAAAAARSAPAGARLKTRFSFDACSPPMYNTPQPAGYPGSTAAAAAAAAAGMRQAAAAGYSYDRYGPENQDWQQHPAYGMQGGSAGGAAPMKYSSVNGSPADSGQQLVFGNAGMGLISTGSGRFVSNGPSLAAAETAMELQTGFGDLQAVGDEDDMPDWLVEADRALSREGREFICSDWESRRPQEVVVRCNGQEATFFMDPATQQCLIRDTMGNAMKPRHFERACGQGACDDWQQSIKVPGYVGKQGPIKLGHFVRIVGINLQFRQPAART